MARPKKTVDYDEEIRRIDMQITRWKNTIKELEEEKERVISSKRESEIGALYQAVQNSGKSVSEAIAMLANQPEPLESAC